MKARRFIEESFPVKEVSAESAREKSIRHGHISTLHIWWARRPLASSRATSYAALLPAPEDIEERNRKREFVIDLCKWENSLNQDLMDRARHDILKANSGKPPRVLDPFAGGGSIPLEALRLGCEVHSSDYNPVAVLLQKCTLEYPQRYGRPADLKTEWVGMRGASGSNPLLDDVRKWGRWVLEEATKEIGTFYPIESDGSIPVGYIWARTIPCQNPSCRGEIPLMRQFWLARNSKTKVALLPHVEGSQVKFRVIGSGYGDWPDAFDSKKGTVSRAIATCLVCGSTADGKTTRKLFKEGKSGERIVAVVSKKRKEPGKRYRIATHRDVQIFSEAEAYLQRKRDALLKDWGQDPVPDEPLPPKDTLGFRVQRYGILKWGDLFNARQKLALVTFVEKVRLAYEKMLENDYEEEYARAIVSYLAICVDRLADYNSVLTTWVSPGEFVGHTFTRQALPMVWDYFELNPASHATGDWNSALGWILRVVEQASQSSSVPAAVFQSSAISLRYPDTHFDAVFTDPPYYDNVPYSHLSDFFYVWLKRSLGHLHPDLFSTPLTPKTNEIVAYSSRKGGWEDAKHFFEEMLRKSFKEIHRVLRPNGIGVVVYTHKSTDGWETLINSLLDSGLVVSGAWPIDTEMKARLRARESAALASSIYIVARKIERESTGFYNEVKEELRNHLEHRLEALWQEGITGADFFIAAIGSAIEVFGRYEKVMDYEGNVVRADRLLDDVRVLVTDYAVHQMLHNGFGGEISDLTRLYVLWRWEFGEAKVPFDDARKLAQSCGVDLAQEWNRTALVSKEGEFLRLLGPTERDVEGLSGSHELVDILHLVLRLWEKGNKDEIAKTLSESGFGRSEAFYRVAQAISETLPVDSKEKKLLDGFLAGRERVREEVRKKTIQKRLIE